MLYKKPEIAVFDEYKTFEVVSTKARLNQVLTMLEKENGMCALDFETTSLSPDDGVIRITSLYGPCGWFVIDHFLCGPPTSSLAVGSDFVVFNVGFEGRWLDHLDYGSARLIDVAFMPKAKLGGGFNLTLAQMVKRDLKEEISKELQNSNWAAKTLTQEQYEYAASDSKLTWRLYEKWHKELTPEQWSGFMVFNEAWRGVVEIEDTSLQLDIDYHETLIARWQRMHDVAFRYVRKWAPEEVLANVNSDVQLGKFFQDNILDDASYRNWPRTGKTNRLDMTREVLVSASAKLPYPISRWVAALVVMRRANKYLSTYGQSLIDSQSRFNRVKSRLNIAAAATGRTSSSSHNLQNIPKSPVVRRSFVVDAKAEVPISGDVADYDGEYRLVMADYSSVEVRVLAAISGDTALMHEAVFGDVHATGAADILKMDPVEFKRVLKDKTEHRQPRFKMLRGRAKALTFSICYGSGIASLALKLKTTEPLALEAFEAWAKRFPKAFAYRQVMFERLLSTGFIQVADGRSIYVFKDDRTLPVASNYGIQGAAASVMYRAIYHVQRLLVEYDLQARLCASVHDELHIKAHKNCATVAQECLETGMALGWLDIFPGTTTDNLADSVIGMHWGQKA